MLILEAYIADQGGYVTAPHLAGLYLYCTNYSGKVIKVTIETLSDPVPGSCNEEEQ